ncbi:hypothetical protein GUITHDRAFT_118054 [Guillardia theta CCMP2712]|uniref:GSKIP domain-containing protein n=2 Tax=Guillardia theta TaxID=55529 RepID=L1IHT3_GUITC|nr:hypothetical protein GUITHDRAFT_118054 [Guillardia theta CCMP2712]EKX35776.1 hypothetical protein GUITHDRAFT_118054 [Guillardia theta CCMP2712]|eukprot:XP_005822756.1 hypothetical protein GUITHDRAFT_118054 [Guillardia theta CCMP2712]
MRGGGQEAAGVALRGSVSHAVVSDEAEGGEGGEGGGGDFISWEISESLRELQRARSARVKEAARSDKDEHVLRVITLEGQELDISVSEDGFLLQRTSGDDHFLGKHFESLHALLHTVSSGYKRSFQQDLLQQLQDLEKGGK